MKLSIITINYNNKDGFRRTADSIISQTFNDYEWIVIDGGSTDGSKELIEQYSDHITYWVSEPDKGVYNAMNKGILQANGDYSLFLNSGDSFSNDKVIEEVLKNGLNDDIVCGNSIYLESKYYKQRYLLSPDNIKASDLILHNLPHQASFIRRKLFSDIHLYDTSYKVVSDWIFFIEAILWHHCSYRHVNMFVSTCEANGISSRPENCNMMEKEFHDALKKHLPIFYDDYVQLRSYLRINNDIKQLFFNKLNQSIVGKTFWKARNLLNRAGYYTFKKKYSTKHYFNRLVKEDNKKKKEIDKLIDKLPTQMLPKRGDNTDFVISLTSYGKRVADAAPYAIYSLFTQSITPDRIVLYLDNDNWNENNIPPTLKRLEQSGLEIRYCNDIKSYKKLIPALQDFPDSPIITVDDDFYYYNDYLKDMTYAYLNSDRRTVLGQWGCIPTKINGNYTPYSKWEDCKYGNCYSEISFFGCCCCYPPHIFDDEILKEDVFMKLCPTADDIWFWAMEERQSIKRQYIQPHGYGLNTPINRKEEMDITIKDTLMYQNVTLGKNDEQCCAVINYYNLDY